MMKLGRGLVKTATCLGAIVLVGGMSACAPAIQPKPLATNTIVPDPGKETANSLRDASRATFEDLLATLYAKEIGRGHDPSDLARTYLHSSASLENEYDAYVKVYGDDKGIVEKYTRVVSDMAKKAADNTKYRIRTRILLSMDKYDNATGTIGFNGIHFDIENEKIVKRYYAKGKTRYAVYQGKPSFDEIRLDVNLADYALKISKDLIFKNLLEKGANTELKMNAFFLYDIKDCTMTAEEEDKPYKAVCDGEILDTYLYFAESEMSPGEFPVKPDMKLQKVNSR